MASPPSLSLQTSHPTSVSDSADHLNTGSINTMWTDDHETRLQQCQIKLARAQKRWSASQDLWIEEVEHLHELKRAHLKALKKQEAQAKKAAGIGKKRTWRRLSRTSSKVDTNTTTTMDDTDPDDEGEEDEVEEEAMSPVDRTDSMREPPTSPMQHSRKSSFSNAVRRLSIAGIRGRRKTSAGNSNAVSATHSGAVTPALDGVFD